MTISGTGAVTARNEGADDYPRLVSQIDAKTRVVACAAGIQWIVQRAKSVRGCRTWYGVSFCRTKRALLRCVRESVPGENLDLEALPDWFPEVVVDVSRRVIRIHGATATSGGAR
jgi:hypothetical protein